MKKILPLLIFAFAMVSFSSVTAQKQEGCLKMEITDVKSDDPNMNSMLGMMKSVVTMFYFTKEKTLVSVDAMGMVQTKILMDNKTNESLMLMDMMGQKFAVKKDLTEEIKNAEANSPKVNVEVVEGANETILGMKCKKVVIKDPENPGLELVAMVTDEIKTDASFIREMDPSALPGFPLKYTVKMDGMEITYMATDYKSSFDKSIMNLSAEGYQMTDEKELQKKLGGGAFGF